MFIRAFLLQRLLLAPDPPAGGGGTPPADPPAPPAPAPKVDPPAPPAPKAAPPAPPAPAPGPARPKTTVADIIARPKTPDAERQAVKAARRILKAAGIDIPKDADVLEEVEKFKQKSDERRDENRTLKGRAAVADEAEVAAKESVEYELSLLSADDQAKAKVFLGSEPPVAQLRKLVELKKSKLLGNAAPAPKVDPPAPGKAPIAPPAPGTLPTDPAPAPGAPGAKPDLKAEIARLESSSEAAVKAGRGGDQRVITDYVTARLTKSVAARVLYPDK
jgi:hypothetical protein